MYGYELEIRGNMERYIKKLYDASGNHVGTISMSAVNFSVVTMLSCNRLYTR